LMWYSGKTARRLLCLTLVALLLGGVVLVIIRVMYTNSGSGAPGLAEGETGNIVVEGNDLAESGLPPIPEFNVPAEYFSVVIRAFQPATEHNHQMQFHSQPIGRLRVTTKDGCLHTILFYDAGKCPLCFSIDGVPYVRDGNYQPLRITHGHES